MWQKFHMQKCIIYCMRGILEGEAKETINNTPRNTLIIIPSQV